jgi:hypothetical protein
MILAFLSITVIVIAFMLLIHILVCYSLDQDPLYFIGSKRIQLTDCFGSTYVSRTRDGKNAYVYPSTKTGRVSLNNDGSVDGSTYIKRWEYLPSNVFLF